MEKRLSQSLLRAQLLGKRKINKPYRYKIDNVEGLNRYSQVILFPRNKLENFLSKTFERIQPTLHWLVHQSTLDRYREAGL